MDGVQLRELLQPILAELGIVPVEVEVRPHGGGVLLQVFLDKQGGITVDDCAQVSRRLNDRLLLNHPELDYTLEVSSPGLDRKLKGPADAAAAVGRTVKVYTRQPVADQLEHAGTLAAVDALALTLTTAGGTAVLPWTMVTTARLDPQLWPASGTKKGPKKR